jgi:hypothetical protein
MLNHLSHLSTPKSAIDYLKTKMISGDSGGEINATARDNNINRTISL